MGHKTQKNKRKSRQLRARDIWLFIVIILATACLVFLLKDEFIKSSTASALAKPAASQASQPEQEPEPQSTPEPTPEPTPAPTPEPTPAPTPEPTGFDQEALSRLDSFVQQQPGRVSVWLKDIESGKVYNHSAGGYYCASTLKAPFALWLSQRAENGELDLNEAMGKTTAWDQIHRMISQSSNGAARLLGERWPADAEHGFTEYLRELGFVSPEGCEVVSEGIHGWVDAQDGGHAMEALYDYFQTGSENAKKLEQAFLDADHNLLWTPGPAAKKYGSWDKALHDMVIVYGEKPYILSVFTDWGDKEVNFPEEGTEMMQQLGKLAAEAVGVTEASAEN